MFSGDGSKFICSFRLPSVNYVVIDWYTCFYNSFS